MDRYQSRTYYYDEYDGGGLQYGGAKYVNNLIISGLNLPSNIGYTIPISYFMDPKFSYGKFMNGDYTMNAPLAVNQMEQICNLLKNHVGEIAANNGSQAYGHDNFNSTTNNYSGHENQTAFYVMSTVNIGSEITLIPGIRYQNLQTSYTGIRGIESRNSFNVYNHYDTTATQSHGYWLPDVSLKYKPVEWFDLRLAYSNTLSYQDYSAVIPRIDLGNGAIVWNNVKLLPSRSQNFDAYFSFYDNNIGLFTVGAFLKRIDNLIYQWSFFSSGADVIQYLPYQLSQNYQPSGTYSVSTYVNDSYVIKDYGAEVNWQTHFWYLPGPLSGLVFDFNYTHIYSKAEYPFVNTVSTGRSIKYVDTSFTDRLIDQPNDIFNCSLGWDYKGLSLRVSMIYSADIFTGVNYWPQLRTHTSAYRRWDIAVKQNLPWYDIQVFGDINNLNSANDVSVIQGGGVPASQQNYGMTADLGLRIKF
jgi:TonB-dependent receptor